jgi:large repetitive protein
VTVTDSNNSPLADSQAYTLTAAAPTISLTPTSLPSPTLGVAYSRTLSASGGIALYTYSINTGTTGVLQSLLTAGHNTGL